MNPHYIAETGQLLFMRQGSLMAVGFDPDRLEIEGNPVLVEEDVMQALNRPDGSDTGAAQLAVSSSGNLAYVRGGVYPKQTNTLMRVTLEGEAEPLNSSSLTNFNLEYPRLSPEGDRLALADVQGQGFKIYVHDFARDTTQLLNTGGFTSQSPAWSPDGESIAFSSNRQDEIENIYSMPADGSGEQPQRLAPSDQHQDMMSWSSDGVISYLQGGDIWMLPPDGEPAPFFTSEVNERWATFSPDGKWLAYSATSTRGREVYIRPYPGPGPAVLVSGNGSRAPAWSRDGTQLYFLQSNASLQRDVMMVVDIADGTSSPARPLMDPWPYEQTYPGRSYDVLADGRIIAVSNNEGFGEDEEQSSTYRELYRVDELQIVFNFIEVLRQRMAD